MSKKLILFNGPPHSGKHTGADYVWCSRQNVLRIKLSAPIKRAIKAMFDFTDAQVAYLESIKDQRDPLLFNRTYREVQISFSEAWAKDLFSFRVFGHLADRAIAASPSSLFVCSDSGFDYEADPMIKRIGKRNTLLVRLHREGCSFANDSRSYIEIPDVLTVDLFNNGSRNDYHSQLDTVIEEWLKTLDS